eukprot:RCo046371
MCLGEALALGSEVPSTTQSSSSEALPPLSSTLRPLSSLPASPGCTCNSSSSNGEGSGKSASHSGGRVTAPLGRRLSSAGGCLTPFPWNEFSAAVLSGIAHAFIEQPIVTPIGATITQMQCNGRGAVYNFLDLLRRRALYRSLPVGIVGAVPKAIINYSILCTYMQLILGDIDIRQASMTQAGLIGGLTGASQVFLVTPINFLKFRMMRPEWGYASTIDAIRRIRREEGILAFWKGTQACLFRDSLAMLSAWVTFKFCDDVMPPEVPFRHATAGALGGLVSSLLTYPLEMLRAARMHNMHFWADIASKGLRRLLAGFWPGAVYIMCSSAIMGTITVQLKPAAQAVAAATAAATATNRKSVVSGQLVVTGGVR